MTNVWFALGWTVLAGLATGIGSAMAFLAKRPPYACTWTGNVAPLCPAVFPPMMPAFALLTCGFQHLPNERFRYEADRQAGEFEKAFRR